MENNKSTGKLNWAKLQSNPVEILIELVLVFTPLYLGLVFSNKLDSQYIPLGKDLVILGGPLAYLGLGVSLVVLWLFSRRRGASRDDFGLKKPTKWWIVILKSLGVALAVLGTVVLLVNPLLNSLPGLEPRDMSHFQVLKGSLPNLLINLVLMWITAGFLEELLWRGYLMNRLMDFFKSTSIITWFQVIILSSIVFGLGHNYQGFYGVLKTGAVGLVFGLAYLAVGKSLWPLVIAHALIDSFDFIRHYFGG